MHLPPSRCIRTILAVTVVVVGLSVVVPAVPTAHAQDIGQAFQNDLSNIFGQLGAFLDNTFIIPPRNRAGPGMGRTPEAGGNRSGKTTAAQDTTIIEDIPRKESEQKNSQAQNQAAQTEAKNQSNAYNLRDQNLQQGGYDPRSLEEICNTAKEGAKVKFKEDWTKAIMSGLAVSGGPIGATTGSLSFFNFLGAQAGELKAGEVACDNAVKQYIANRGYTDARSRLTQRVEGGYLGSAVVREELARQNARYPVASSGGGGGPEFSQAFSNFGGQIYGQFMGKLNQLTSRVGFSMGGGGGRPGGIGSERFYLPGGMSQGSGGRGFGSFNFNPQSMFSGTFGAISGTFSNALNNIFDPLNRELDRAFAGNNGSFFGPLFAGLFQDRGSRNTGGNGIGNPTIYPNQQTILATQFAVPGSEGYLNLIQPVYQPTGKANVLSLLSNCPDPSKPGPTDCVLDDAFRSAIESGLTVRQALDQGFLKADGAFGFRSDGLEPSYQEGYPYRTLVILRKYRIIPIGWELAAQYIKTHSPKTLGEVIAKFDDSGDTASPFRGLIDPNWVLTAPELFCRRAGPGPQIVQEKIQEGTDADGNGDFNDPGDTPPSRTIVRNQNYCADEQTCLEKGPDGRCKYYGYCSAERRVWDLAGTSCEPVYNSCETFTTREGEEIGYLKNTLDYRSCTLKSAGCTAYAFPQRPCANDADTNCLRSDDRELEHRWKAGRDHEIYLNAQAQKCEPEYVGCSEFLQVKRGDQFLPANTFRDRDPNTAGVQPVVKDAVGSIEKEIEAVIQLAKTKGTYAGLGEGYSASSVYLNANRLSCKAEEVGCDRYTPVSSSDDLVVPAVIGEADRCYAQCVGQDQYRQAPTSFEISYSSIVGGLTGSGSGTAVLNEIFSTATPQEWSNARSLSSVSGTGGTVVESIRRPGFTWWQRAGIPSCQGAMYLAGKTAKALPATMTPGFYRLTVQYIGGGRVKDEQYYIQANVLQGTSGTPVASAQTPLLVQQNTLQTQQIPLLIPPFKPADGALSLELDVRTASGSIQEDVYLPRLAIYNNGTCGVENPTRLNGYWIQSVQLSASTPTNAQLSQLPFITQREAVVLIPAKGAQCSAPEAGCDEFTNLDEVARGGEIKEYFNSIKFCKKPAKAGEVNNSTLYLIEQGNDRTGYQITTHELVAEGAPGNPQAGAPCTQLKTDGTCQARSDAACNLATNPDCREFIGLNHQKYLRLFSQTVTVSDECHPYRRTKIAWTSDDLQKQDCERTNGRWEASGQGCVYNILKSAVAQCNAKVAGCREYQNSTSGNVQILFDERFDDTTTIDRWTSSGSATPAWVQTTQSELAKGRSMELVSSTARSLALPTQPKTLAAPLVAGRQYLISFWARTVAQTGTRALKVAVGDTTTIMVFGPSDGTLIESGVWKEYRLGPVLLTQALSPDANPEIKLEAIGDATAPRILIDNLRILNANQFVVSGSWLPNMDEVCKIPDALVPASAGGQSGDPMQKGCRAYDAEHAQTRVTLKSFTNLCAEDHVGCSAVIDTKNSSSPNARPPEGDEPPTTAVVEDSVTYVVDNRKNYCPREAKGCMLLGRADVDARTSVATHTARVVLNDPDRYTDSSVGTGMLCTEAQVGCNAFVGRSGVAVFKDPGSAVCDYYIKEGDSTPQWWRRRYANTDAFDRCPIDYKHTIGSNGSVETPKAEPFVNKDPISKDNKKGKRESTPPDVALSPEPGHDRKRFWAGSCPKFANSCTELIDTRSTIATGIVDNSNFSQNLSARSVASGTVDPIVRTPPTNGKVCPVGTHLVATDVIEYGKTFRAPTNTEVRYSSAFNGHFYFTCQLGESTESDRYGVTLWGIQHRATSGCPDHTTPVVKNYLYTQSLNPGANAGADIYVCQRSKTQDPPVVPPSSAVGQCQGTPDSWRAIADDGDPDTRGDDAATTQYRALEQSCVVNNAKQKVFIEPNRLYVVEARVKGTLTAVIQECEANGLDTKNTYEFVSPDASMKGGGSSALLTARTTKDDDATQTEERVVTGRFLLRPTGSAQGSTLTRRCLLSVDVGPVDMTNENSSKSAYTKSVNIRPAGVYYALGESLTSEGCNGVVDPDIGCVLMNNRAVVGEVAPKNLLKNEGFGTTTQSTQVIRRLKTIPNGPKSKPVDNGTLCPVGTRLSLVAVSTNEEEIESELPALDPDFDTRVDIVHQEGDGDEEHRYSYTRSFSFTCTPGIAGQENRYGVRSSSAVICPAETAPNDREFSGIDEKKNSVTDTLKVCESVGGNMEGVNSTVDTPAEWRPNTVSNYGIGKGIDGSRYTTSASQDVAHLAPGYYRLEAFATGADSMLKINCNKPTNTDWSTAKPASEGIRSDKKSGTYRAQERAKFLYGDGYDTTTPGGVTTLPMMGGIWLNAGTRAKFVYIFQLVANKPKDCTISVLSPEMIDNVSLSFSTNEAHLGLEDLTYDANRSGVDNSTTVGKTALQCSAADQTTHVCQTNANVLIQATPDRQCGTWLACRSALQAKDPQGNSENLCFDVGSCTQFGANGECRNFNLQEKKPQVYTASSNQPLRDQSGFSNPGIEWSDLAPAGFSPSTATNRYDNYGWYPVAAMSQIGNVVHVPNGGFEEVGVGGQPRSWKTEDVLHQNDPIFAPAWSRGIYEAVDNPLGAQKEGVQARSGLSYLAVRGENRAVTTLIHAFGKTQYVVSAALNTSALKRPAKVPAIIEPTDPLAFGQIIIAQYDSSQKLLNPVTTTATCPTIARRSDVTSGNFKPKALRLPFGIGWKELTFTFTTCENTSYVQLKVGALLSSAVAVQDQNLKPEGSVYADDVQMSPILAVAPGNNVTRSCRLYPTADSPSCRFANQSGVRFKGVEGYCLLKDPNNASVCLQWYPVDVISGDERGETQTSYRGKAPLYYCTEMKIIETRLVKPALARLDIVTKCNFLCRIVNGGGAVGVALGAVMGNGLTLGQVANVLAAGFSDFGNAKGSWQTGDCLSDDGYSQYSTSETKKSGGVFGIGRKKTTTTRTYCQAAGAVLFTSHDQNNNKKNWYEYNGTQWNIDSQVGGGDGFTEETKAVCMKVTKTVQADGENYAWSGRLTEGGIPFVSELGYTYASNSQPFGAVVPPASGDPDDPSTWNLDFPLPIIDDNSSAHGGSPYSCSNDKAHGKPVCQVSFLHGIRLGTNKSSLPFPTGGLEQCSDASRRLKHLFIKDFGTWEWGGSCRPAEKVCKREDNVWRSCVTGKNANNTYIKNGTCDTVQKEQKCVSDGFTCIDEPITMCDTDGDCAEVHDPILCDKGRPATAGASEIVPMITLTPITSQQCTGDAARDGRTCTNESQITLNCNVLNETDYPGARSLCQQAQGILQQAQFGNEFSQSQANALDLDFGPCAPKSVTPGTCAVLGKCEGGSNVDGVCHPLGGASICGTGTGVSCKTTSGTCQGGSRSGAQCTLGRDAECRGTGEKEGYVPLAAVNQCNQSVCQGGTEPGKLCSMDNQCAGGGFCRGWGLPDRQCPKNIRPIIQFAYCREANDYYSAPTAVGGGGKTNPQDFVGRCVGGPRDGKGCVTLDPALQKDTANNARPAVLFAPDKGCPAGVSNGEKERLYDYYGPLSDDPYPYRKFLNTDIFNSIPDSDESKRQYAINPDAEYCAVTPVVRTAQLNTTEVRNSGFVNLKFTSEVDANQLPMTAYKVDWGDGETATLSGVEISPRPNIDNPHSLFHLYSYWDILQKIGAKKIEAVTNEADVNSTRPYCSPTNGYCVVKIRIQIRDKWGWCNSNDPSMGYRGNDCSVEECVGGGACPWKIVTQTVKIFQERVP